MENRTEPKHAGTGLEGQDRTFSSGVIGPSHVSMRLLDPGNATELEQFEQAFFRGFRQASYKLRIPHDSASHSITFGRAVGTWRRGDYCVDRWSGVAGVGVEVSQ
jgi:hypothetical protein